MKHLNEKIFCYLTKDARRIVDEMTDKGCDKDLALSLLELVWPEDAIYSLPAEDSGDGIN